MIYITLPLLYYNSQFNNKLYNFKYKYHIKDLFNIDLKITSFYGSIPFAIWNGGSNLNIKDQEFLKYYDIVDFFETKISAPARLDCSNLLLTNFDIDNQYQNIILKLGENKGFFLEISDFDLYHYINDNYTNFEFIFSKNAHYKHPFDSDILNTICEQDAFHLIELPQELMNDIDFLNSLKYKNKIEILIGNKCPNNCLNIKNCSIFEQENILLYSEKTIYYDCKFLNSYQDMDLLQQILFYKNLGFTHFKIDTPPLNKNTEFKQYVISNLIKDKYQLYYENNI